MIFFALPALSTLLETVVVAAVGTVATLVTTDVYVKATQSDDEQQ